jgi:hypothetical protein
MDHEGTDSMRLTELSGDSKALRILVNDRSDTEFDTVFAEVFHKSHDRGESCGSHLAKAKKEKNDLPTDRGIQVVVKRQQPPELSI